VPRQGTNAATQDDAGAKAPIHFRELSAALEGPLLHGGVGGSRAQERETGLQPLWGTVFGNLSTPHYPNSLRLVWHSPYW